MPQYLAPGVLPDRLKESPSGQKSMAVCVFCGSASGRRGHYYQAAQDFGRALVARGMSRVYGGAHTGLMRVIADAVIARGGSVSGVIPQELLDRELAHPEVSPLYVVQGLHQRKAMMARLSDGFVALPGGPGTLEELAEVWTWGQLGLHRKPCALLNINGYYDPFTMFVQHMTNEGFLANAYQEMIVVSEDPEDLLEKLVAYRPPPVKWAVQELPRNPAIPEIRPDIEVSHGT